MSPTCSENTIDSSFNYLEQNNHDIIITSRMKTRKKSKWREKNDYYQIPSKNYDLFIRRDLMKSFDDECRITNLWQKYYEHKNRFLTK